MTPEHFIHIAGLRIDEPITVLTDLIVAGICIFAYVKVLRKHSSSRAGKFFAIFFLGLGIGTTLGGLLGHAFLYGLQPAWQLPGWLISMAATSLLVMGSMEVNRENLHPRLLNSLIILNLIGFIALATLVTITIDFIYVVVHIAISLLGMLLFLHLYGWFKTGHPGHLRFLGAIGIMILAAFFFLLKLGINVWIDHNSISHSLIAVSAVFFYYGARKFLFH